MPTLQGLHFNKPFRPYQQRVLDGFESYAKDGHVNVVAAPGSGKTVLGLEMICRLGAPALVLSPSVTVRQQWGSRFVDGFLPAGDNPDDYVSYSLLRPSAITSITYQALHAAWTHKKTAGSAADDETDDVMDEAAEEDEDFSDFDVLDAVKRVGISTICLDEAHHLRAEWQRALEAFLKALGGSVMVISLTATPPYDSTPTEWQRFIDACGEIDEEVFVPELVRAGNLCPHQDYVWFSYPTTSERAIVRRYRTQAATAIDELAREGTLARCLTAATAGTRDEVLDRIYSHENELKSLFSLCQSQGIAVDQTWLKVAAPHGRLGRLTPSSAEVALQYVLDTPEVFGACTDEVRSTLERHSLLNRRRVSLKADPKTSRRLSASLGKLASIRHIASLELGELGPDLRMVVLTDYIKADLVPLIGCDCAFDQMGAVPIFEELRREVGERTSLALLSGSLVIVPAAASEKICALAGEMGSSCSSRPLSKAGVEVPYVELVFGGSNQDKVEVMTRALDEGLLNVIVGTKSLLGEGWDSPCVNTLVLASFVGSFMLSNQMRGRAIRTDPKRPNKTANIWHLVCADPPLSDLDPKWRALFERDFSYDESALGEDWDTLVRRFACFMAPAYDRPVIESGIERLGIQGPFDEKGLERINAQMEAHARDRVAMARSWEAAFEGASSMQVNETCEIPVEDVPKPFALVNALPLLVYSILEYALLYGLNITMSSSRAADTVADTATDIVVALSLLLAVVIIAIAGVKLVLRLARSTSPKAVMLDMGSALLDALTEVGLIKTRGARLVVKSTPDQTVFLASLEGGTLREKTLYMQAYKELLSPIDNPRYVIVRHLGVGGKLDFTHSFAVPEVLAQRREDVDALVRALSKSLGHYEAIYTRNPAGRETLWECHDKSQLNVNERRLRLVESMS